MEAWLKGKKRKSETPADTIQDDDSESTDVKLAILASLHPNVAQEALLDCLLEHDGSIEAASGALTILDVPKEEKKPRNPAVIGSQTSLKFFTGNSAGTGDASSPKKPRLMSKKGTTLHLYDPEDIAEHTPCSIIHNFLPADMANDLLKEMLEESKTFEKITFKLFDNVVQSPHTSTFYVETDEELSIQKHEYFYNGARLTVSESQHQVSEFILSSKTKSRPEKEMKLKLSPQDVRKITPQLLRVKPLVQESVNREIEKRIKTVYPRGEKLRFQSSDTWKPNAAFVNCYAGPQENVGYHSDQLTYLGPRAVIGSLSLGVAREFRVRRIVPKDADEKTTDTPDLEGQIAIHLPHNSLLVMHAEMQEEWKHSIAPAQVIDPHPIAGNRRINVTYRDYKANLHPKLTPKCKCGIPAVLKVVQRRKENHSRYFWMCHGGYVPGKEKCGFFQWADFDDDGNPSWDRARYRKGTSHLPVCERNEPGDADSLGE